MPVIGFLLTLKSAILGNKYVMYAMIIGGIVLAIMFYGAKKEKQGFKRAVAESIEAAQKRAERHKEITNEISRLPLSDRAKRLRDLDSSG